MILSYGAANQQADVVDALIDAGVDPGRILVVHNPDGTAEGARPNVRPGVLARGMERNIGYGGGMNAGVTYWLSRGVEWILLLTHDLRLEPESLHELVDAARRHPDFGVLGPVLVNAITRQPFSYGGIDIRENIVGHRERPPAQADQIAACAWVDGTAMLIRARAFQEAGPIEPRFFMYFEEPEFCARVRGAGWKVGVVIGARALTDPGLPRRAFVYGYLFARNGVVYAWRTGGARKVALAVASQVRASLYLALRPADPRFDAHRKRRWRWQAAVGVWLGMVGAVLGDRGPPPRPLRRFSDIAGT